MTSHNYPHAIKRLNAILNENERAHTHKRFEQQLTSYIELYRHNRMGGRYLMNFAFAILYGRHGITSAN